MKALLKDGKTWVDIDPSFLADNQYNTVDGKRIFDHDILSIKDDIRHNMGKCRYCGAIVRRGEEEKHFTERESQGCAGCFWQSERVTDRKVSTDIQITNGQKTTIKKTVETIEKVCCYGKNERQETSGCNLKECRRMGIYWFTPKNTFFLEYPDGFSPIEDLERLENLGFVFTADRCNAHYKKKIGSYGLNACLSYENGKPSSVEYFILSNCRRSYKFRIENGKIYTDKYSFGFYRVKTLEGVPADVMAKVKELCNHERSGNNDT